MLSMSWHNFDTGGYDENPDIATMDDEQVMVYLLRYEGIGGGPARNLYRCYRAMGDDQITALTKALSACVGEKADGQHASE